VYLYFILSYNFPTYSLFICRTITANKSYMLFYLVIMIKIQFIWTWLIDCSLTYRNKYFMHIQGKNKINYRETVSWTWVSEWLLFNSNSAISQLYHSENKLIFNEIMMRSTTDQVFTSGYTRKQLVQVHETASVVQWLACSPRVRIYICRLFEICFHFAGHRFSTQEFSAGPSEFLPDLHFYVKLF
jgi:hypothetical protein